MKKVLYICLTLLVFGGLGAGYWLLKSDSSSDGVDSEIVEEPTSKYVDQPITFAYKDLESTKHLATYEPQFASFSKLETATNSVLFAPTTAAIETFVKDTALDVVKFLPYHVVISELPIEVVDGAKLKTDDGQELVIVTVSGNLHVRDAKGNDVRLRRPIEAKNGKIYIIDKVLLTQ